LVFFSLGSRDKIENYFHAVFCRKLLKESFFANITQYWKEFSARPVPENRDPVFAKTSPKRSFCMTENERFGLVFVKTRSMNSGTGKNNPVA
jgi:hypothetical protein